MMNPLSYPEQHDTWLSAMNIVRWQQRTTLVKGVHHIETKTDSQDVIFGNQNAIWPDLLLHTRYWLIATSSLHTATAYLLAGMMKAIHATIDEVVYINIGSDVQDNMATGLSSWPMVNVQTLPESIFMASLAPPENVQVLWLGNELQKWDALKGSSAPLVLPDLAEMLVKPELKREAWNILKQLLNGN